MYRPHEKQPKGEQNEICIRALYVNVTRRLHRGVPIFVPSHRPPGPSAAKYPLVTYVNDGIASAMAQAKAAAKDKDVMVHGAYTAQRALEAGVLNELQIHQILEKFMNRKV